MTMRSERLGVTPSQTVGPYLHIGLTWEGGNLVVPRQTPGAIDIIGTLYDGIGQPIADGLIVTWQADPAGRFDHDDDPRGAVKPLLHRVIDIDNILFCLGDARRRPRYRPGDGLPLG